jgi:hypothetical protein
VDVAEAQLAGFVTGAAPRKVRSQNPHEHPTTLCRGYDTFPAGALTLDSTARAGAWCFAGESGSPLARFQRHQVVG